MRTRILQMLSCCAVAMLPLCVHAATPLKPQAACVNGQVTEIAANSDLYLKKGLKPKCSANINLYYAQTEMGLIMSVNSTKGRHTFTGSTMVGKLTQHKACASACTAAEAESAVQDLIAAGQLK